MTSRPSTAAPILAVLAIVLVTLGAYVAGYLGLGVWGVYAPTYGNPPVYVRAFRYPWQRAIFWPAAKIESLLIGHEVRVIYVPRLLES